MIRAIARAAALALLITGLSAGALVLRHTSAELSQRARRSPVVRRAAPPGGAGDSVAAALLAAAPWRLRRTLAVPYDPVTIGTPKPPAAIAAEKPPVTLSGIVWSDRPIAILDGVPGLERGWLVERGDTSGGIRIRRIRRREVSLSGYDTTWTLRLKEFP